MSEMTILLSICLICVIEWHCCDYFVIVGLLCLLEYGLMSWRAVLARIPVVIASGSHHTLPQMWEDCVVVHCVA